MWEMNSKVAMGHRVYRYSDEQHLYLGSWIYCTFLDQRLVVNSHWLLQPHVGLDYLKNFVFSLIYILWLCLRNKLTSGSAQTMPSSLSHTDWLYFKGYRAFTLAYVWNDISPTLIYNIIWCNINIGWEPDCKRVFLPENHGQEMIHMKLTHLYLWHLYENVGNENFISKTTLQDYATTIIYTCHPCQITMNC